MPTPVTPTFNRLTDARVLWVNVDAANNFFDAFSFTISGANLPVPTVADLGGVKLLEIPVFVAPALTSQYVNLVIDDGGTQQQVPTKAAYDTLVTQVDTLNQFILQLYNQLLAKGYVSVV